MGTFVPSSLSSLQEMIKSLGLNSIQDLFVSLPDGIRLTKPLSLPLGKSEIETFKIMDQMANRNLKFTSIFRGAGAYWHYIPSIIKRVTSKEEFLTSYTPYQPEISQGILQLIFEYQTMICELTGMDVSNASVYDGATAAAEAIAMCREKNKETVIVSATVNPQVIQTLSTYCKASGVKMFVVSQKDGVTDLEFLKNFLKDNKTACFYMEQPNYFGQLEAVDNISSILKEKDVKFILGCNPISLGVLQTPAECGVDIAVGEGQPLGLPLAFGGPYLGFMACKKELTRKLPGRIVGETTDKDGRRVFVLTLQTREQHIKREKATSNSCTNQSLCALRAGAYLTVMGAVGLHNVAKHCVLNARYLENSLAKLGFIKKYKTVNFHEFVTTSPVDCEILMRRLEQYGILGGLPLEGELSGHILWCATELITSDKTDSLIYALREVIAA